MTRAKRKLVFTCPLTITTGNKPRDVSPSSFFVEAGVLPEVHTEVADPLKISTLLYSPSPKLDEAFEAFLRDRLKDFRLSVTALNHFLEDPRLFLAKDLLQTPSLMESPLVYGNAVHAALKKWGMSIQDGLPIGQELFIDEFTNYLVDREILTEVQRKSLIEQGRRDLPRYYEQRLAANVPVIYRVEFPIKANIGDIPLKGKIDRIDLDHPDSNKATIIDFKTGKPKTEGQIREDGNYFRQLAFYALLMEHGMPLYEPVSYVLDFIGEGTEHPIERKFSITDTEKQELSKIITDVWKKIQKLDFTPL